jgi:hypothetical protein
MRCSSCKAVARHFTYLDDVYAHIRGENLSSKSGNLHSSSELATRVWKFERYGSLIVVMQIDLVAVISTFNADGSMHPPKDCPQQGSKLDVSLATARTMRVLLELLSLSSMKLTRSARITSERCMVFEVELKQVEAKM